MAAAHALLANHTHQNDWVRNCSRGLDCPIAFHDCIDGQCACNPKYGLEGARCKDLTYVSVMAVWVNLLSGLALTFAATYVIVGFLRVQIKTQFKHLFDPGIVTIICSVVACLALVARLGLLTAAIIGYEVPKYTYVVAFAVLEGLGFTLLLVSTLNICLLWLQALQNTSSFDPNELRASVRSSIQRASKTVGSLLETVGIDFRKASRLLVVMSILYMLGSATMVVLEAYNSDWWYFWGLYGFHATCGTFITVLYSYGAHVLREKASRASSGDESTSSSGCGRLCKWFFDKAEGAPSGTRLAKILPPILRTARRIVASFAMFLLFSFFGFIALNTGNQGSAWVCTLGIHVAGAVIVVTIGRYVIHLTAANAGKWKAESGLSATFRTFCCCCCFSKLEDAGFEGPAAAGRFERRNSRDSRNGSDDVPSVPTRLMSMDESAYDVQEPAELERPGAL
jgi:hypothetical protein